MIMSVRMPSNLGRSGALETALDLLGHEILAQKAAALGRAGQRVEESLKKLRENGENARRPGLLKEAAAADVRSEDDVAAALDVADSLGALRVAVNCAGTGNAIRILGKKGVFPLEDFKKIIDINLVGSFNVIRLAAERMVKHEPAGEERGVIVNTASVAAFDGQIGQTAYSASKAGVVGRSRFSR